MSFVLVFEVKRKAGERKKGEWCDVLIFKD